MIIDAIAAYPLLEHPFYRRWATGEVSLEELRDYAAEYRFFEAALPGILQDLIASAEPELARRQLEHNLADELGGPARPSHLELFDRFAAALDAPNLDSPAPAMAALISTLRELADNGAAAGLAGLLAYELQLPDVAVSKAEGLRRHYELDGDAVAFWNLHAELDVEHARWGLAALDALEPDALVVRDAAERAARAWWTFLDEREAVRPAA